MPLEALDVRFGDYKKSGLLVLHFGFDEEIDLSEGLLFSNRALVVMLWIYACSLHPTIWRVVGMMYD